MEVTQDPAAERPAADVICRWYGEEMDELERSR
jgi:hypothetical protein